ncbi:hypothetical protein GDO78_021645 [Eleutherodactylus coqui]|uniref:Uncharacterized protein n=1 Tax=Eleutherodactylus coqui TaxID=57060 RepID=A0A8J6E7X4_ELECQ|nr:hypothetical protein GDO78_021645 [Eleutherodactylus coqui]
MRGIRLRRWSHSWTRLHCSSSPAPEPGRRGKGHWSRGSFLSCQGKKDKLESPIFCQVVNISPSCPKIPISWCMIFTKPG